MKFLNKNIFKCLILAGLALGITPNTQAVSWSAIRNCILAATAVRAVYDACRDRREDYTKSRVHWEALLYMASFGIMVFDHNNIAKEWFPAASATKEITSPLVVKSEQKLMKLLGQLQQ